MAARAREPNPINHRQLEAAKSRNGLTKLHLQCFGLSDEETLLTLRHGIRDQGHSTFLANAPGREKADTTECRVVRFDDWIATRDEFLPLPAAPGWIAKIDVEGFEPRVLRGMEDSLRRRRFLGLCVELNASTLSLAGASRDDVRGFLAECGYTALENTPAGRQWPLHRAPNGFFVPEKRTTDFADGTYWKAPIPSA